MDWQLLNTGSVSGAGAQEPAPVKPRQAGAAVTITWPNLSELPDKLVAYLVDPATGQRLYMRTARSYSFRTGANGARRDFITGSGR